MKSRVGHIGEEITRAIDKDHVDLTRRVAGRLRPHATIYPQPLHSATLDFTFIHIEVMRRAQSVRHYNRASVSTTGTNDMGMLKEVPEESTEVSLRRQLLDKSKENDKVCGSSIFVTSVLIWLLSFPMQLRDQIQALQGQLAQRPPIEAIQELRKEYSNLELILQGTQRENERAMTELERLTSQATLV